MKLHSSNFVLYNRLKTGDKNYVFKIVYDMETYEVISVVDENNSGLDISDGKFLLFGTGHRIDIKQSGHFSMPNLYNFFLCNGFLLGFDSFTKAVNAREKIELLKNLESVEDMMVVLRMIE